MSCCDVCKNIAYKIAKISAISIKFDTGYVLTLGGVIYIPKITRISEWMGVARNVESIILKVTKGSLVTCKAVNINRIYIINVEVTSGLNSYISSIHIDDTQVESQACTFV